MMTLNPSLSNVVGVDATAPPPPGPVATHLFMEPDSPDPSVAGQTVNISAVLTRADNGAPISSASIVMEGSDDGGVTWWPAGTYFTDSSGRARGSVVFLYPHANQALRASFAGNTSYLASTSNIEPHVTVASSSLTVDFSFTPSSPAVGQTVTFTGSATGGTSPYTYSWVFGDGGTATGASVSHAYSSAGTRTVTLTVSDSIGTSASVSKSVTVSATPPPLAADFTVSPSSPTVGQAASFAGSASGGTSPYSYSWAFGDGATATGGTVSHTYAATGTYTVTLTVTDSASHTVTVTKSVTVVAAPPPGTSFKFGAWGDTGYYTNFQNNLQLAKSLNPDFMLHLGDCTYSNTKSSVDSFKTYIRSALGTTPYMIVWGNHESNYQDYLTDFSPPDLPVTGTYGSRYYFDFPLSSPFARIICVCPGITELSGIDGNYGTGTANLQWLSDRIDEAKALGYWTIVCQHKNWISMGVKGNEVGTPYMSLCLSKGVDLILEGHDHNYQRAKQWKTPITGTQPTIAGVGPSYTKGAGTVLVINGSGGLNLYAISPSDPDAPYFADNPLGEGGKAAYGSATNQYGVLLITVTPTKITAVYDQLNGRLNMDAFTIG